MVLFLKQILLKTNKTNSENDSGESGFTIIESLIAIVVVAILMTAIAPVIVFSTATRVQARRVEMATQAARSFIDALRTEKVDSSKIETIQVNGLASRKISSNSGDYLIDTNEMKLPTNKTKLYCFNKDSTFGEPGCTSDLFYIQAARISVTNSTQPKDGYRLAIRIYRHDTEFTKIKQQDEYRKKQSTATGGLGSRLRPLLQMSTDISGDDTSFEALCQRLGSASGSCS
ncbi:MAG: hormogonium polysaccharide secretion pseudopilin HpsB [Cyanobacteria bacterium P01_A01_bin.84]